jgi:hypothetical protein
VYDRENDIEYMLKQDAREKKKTGSGVFSRASRRGYTGAVRTHVDYLKGKAKKEYMKNGEIKVSNIYDDINNVPSVEKIREMEHNTARNIILAAKSKHGMKELVKHWGFSDNYLYTKFFPEYEIPTRTYKPREVKATEQVTLALPKDDKPVMNPEPVSLAAIPVDIFEIGYIKNDVDGKTIQDRITNYLSVLEEDGIYDIKFTIREKARNY